MTAPSTSSIRSTATPPDSARIMALVVHPYIMGAPHRLKYFRNALAHIRQHQDVLFWTGEEILDWFLSADRAEAERESVR